MIPIRLSWLQRARPSATLHEIQVCSESKLVTFMLRVTRGCVKTRAPMRSIGIIDCENWGTALAQDSEAKSNVLDYRRSSGMIGRFPFRRPGEPYETCLSGCSGVCHSLFVPPL